MVNNMRKHYIYAILLVVLSLAFSLGYYFYFHARTTEYRYGTFVEIPKESSGDIRELCA